MLALGDCDEHDLVCGDGLAAAPPGAIEDALAERHLADGVLILYDVSCAAFERRSCLLGEIGQARDGVRGRLQIVYRVFTDYAGCLAEAGGLSRLGPGLAERLRHTGRLGGPVGTFGATPLVGESTEDSTPRRARVANQKQTGR